MNALLMFAGFCFNGNERSYSGCLFGSLLKSGIDFDHAYASVVQSNAESATVWIRFCVQSVSRFQHQPAESEFLAVLEECCRKHVGA